MPIKNEDGSYWVSEDGEEFKPVDNLWDTGQVSKRDRKIVSMKTKAEGTSTHTPSPSNAVPNMYRPKFYPDDPNDNWDTGLRDSFDFDIDGFKHGDIKIGKKRFNWDALSTKKDIHQPSINSFGRRLRKMSTKISIPIIPLLIVFWAVGGFDLFDDNEKTETTKPTVEVTENKSFKEEVVGVMDKIEKNIIPAAKEKWEQAKEELNSDEPDPTVAKNESSDDPYTEDDRYGTTDRY